MLLADSSPVATTSDQLDHRAAGSRRARHRGGYPFQPGSDLPDPALRQPCRQQLQQPCADVGPPFRRYLQGGGDAGDQHQLYLLSLFTTTPQENINGLWNIFYSGLARANNVISACENAVGFDTEADIKKLNQYKAEAHFLRAYYTHWLWKFWGNVPYFEEPLTEPPYMTRQYTADEVYAEIMEDIDVATTEGYLPLKTVGINAGRINRAAALMLKARVVLYQKDAARYGEVTADMAEIIASGDYSLMPDFAGIWVDAGEFNQESIFEANHLPEGKTWDSGWQGYGTNLPAFISPNGLSAGNETGDYKGGWGFGPVRQPVWDLYEEGDSRREGSINKWEPDSTPPAFRIPVSSWPSMPHVSVTTRRGMWTSTTATTCVSSVTQKHCSPMPR